MSALLRNHLLNEPYTHLKSQPTALSTFPTLPCFLLPLHSSQLVYQQLTNHGYSCFFSQSSWIVKRLPSTQNSTQDKAGAPSILPERSSVGNQSSTNDHLSTKSTGQFPTTWWWVGASPDPEGEWPLRPTQQDSTGGNAFAGPNCLFAYKRRGPPWKRQEFIMQAEKFRKAKA